MRFQKRVITEQVMHQFVRNGMRQRTSLPPFFHKNKCHWATPGFRPLKFWQLRFFILFVLKFFPQPRLSSCQFSKRRAVFIQANNLETGLSRERERKKKRALKTWVFYFKLYYCWSHSVRIIDDKIKGKRPLLILTTHQKYLKKCKT